MSKELEALNKVKKFKDDCCMFGSSDIEIDRELDIIETVLKDHQDLHEYIESLQDDRDYWWNIANKNEKKLKALELIKEKCVIPAYIVNTKNVEQYNKWLRGITFRKDWLKKRLTKEEYDILREVFL